MSLLIALFFTFYSFNSLAVPSTVVTHFSAQTSSDKRLDYDHEVLRLSLEKTAEDYGPFTLTKSIKLNYKRARVVAREDSIKNFIYKQSVSKELLEELGSIHFPIDLGIVGYRVFLTSKNSAEKLKKVKSLKDLRVFTFGQGVGWLDSRILRSHQLKVTEGTNYNGLFNMVSTQKFDLFPRGINEVLSEWETFSKSNVNMVLDKGLVLYYPLPRFFFTNKNNKKLIERVRTGLERAYSDGSLLKLWKRHYSNSLKFVELKKRKTIKLSNPFLEGISKDYEKYIFTP
jgi:hypothetical protein